MSVSDGSWQWWTGLLNTTTESTELALVSDVNRTNYTALIGEFYDDFEHVSENYLMTTLAVLGIVLNTLAMAATCRDVHMRRMSRAVHCIFFVAENLFLSGFVGFLQLRGHERRLHRDKEHDLEVRAAIFPLKISHVFFCFGYFTVVGDVFIFVGLFVCLSVNNNTQKIVDRFS